MSPSEMRAAIVALNSIHKRIESSLVPVYGIGVERTLVELANGGLVSAKLALAQLVLIEEDRPVPPEGRNRPSLN
jgi:hypothetical protein